MQYIFTFVMLAAAAYFYLGKRRFDLFSAAYTGCVLYFLPGFFGVSRYKVGGEWITTDIAGETYAVMAFVALMIMVFGIISDSLPSYSGKPPPESPKNNRRLLLALLFASAGALLLLILTAGSQIFSPDKSEVLEGLNRWHIIYRYSSHVGFCLAFLLASYRFSLVFLALILFDVYLGFRSGLAMSIGTVLMLQLNRLGPIRLLLHAKKVTMYGALCIAGVVIYKGYGGHVKAGNWSYIAENKMTFEEFVRPFYEMESFVIINNLNQIIISNYKVGFWSFVDQILAGVIPFANHLGVGLNRFAFQQTLFSDINYGAGSTIWGQLWSSGGWPLLIVFVTLFCISLRLGARLLTSYRVYAVAPLAYALFIWAVYIHRNNIGYQLNMERRVLMVLLGMWIFLGLVSLAKKKSPSRFGSRLQAKSSRAEW